MLELIAKIILGIFISFPVLFFIVIFFTEPPATYSYGSSEPKEGDDD